MRRVFLVLVLLLCFPALPSHAGMGAGAALPEERVCGEDNPMPFPRPKYFPEWHWNALAALRNNKVEQALGWYRVGMEANSPEAFERAGQLFDEGRCTLPRNPAMAAELYRRAGELGDWSSLIRLGLLTLAGDGVPASAEQADALFRRGLIRNLPFDVADTRRSIQRYILRDRPMPAELETGLAWLEEVRKLPPSSAPLIAADFLDPAALRYDPVAGCEVIERGGYKDARVSFALYQLLASGAEGLKAKPRLADYWLIAAAMEDSGPANAELGRRLLAGDRAQRQPEWAHWHLLAAERAGEDVSGLLEQIEKKLRPGYVAKLRTDPPLPPWGLGLSYEYPSPEQPACERTP